MGKIKGKNIQLIICILIIFLWDFLNFQLVDNLPLVVILSFYIINIIITRKIYIKKGIILFVGYLIIDSLINILLKNDTIVAAFSQILAICVCALYYTDILHKFSINKILKYYYMSAVLMATIGLLELFISIFNLTPLMKIPFLFLRTDPNYKISIFVKLCSLCNEPSYLGYYLFIPFSMIVFNKFSGNLVKDTFINRTSKISRIIIVICYLCTFSLNSYTGLLLVLLVCWFYRGISINKVLMLVIIVLVIALGYFKIPDIKTRIDDTVSVFTSDQTNIDTNLSTSTYFNNYNIAKKSAIDSHFLGTGIGSYQYRFDKYNRSMWTGSGYIKNELNREDGNSGLFRIFTELGIIGIIIVIAYLVAFFPRGEAYRGISLSLIILFILFLIRQGNYTHGGSVLFIGMYYYNYLASKAENTTGETKDKDNTLEFHNT